MFATGHHTEFGKTAALSRDVPASPLAAATGNDANGSRADVIAVVMGLIFFAYGLSIGRSLWVNIVFMLGIIVANVPEGLLPTFTLSHFPWPACGWPRSRCWSRVWKQLSRSGPCTLSVPTRREH